LAAICEGLKALTAGTARGNLGAAFAICLMAAMQTDEDEFLWLEDIDSDQALAWVRAQNKRSLDHLEADPRYQPMYEQALAILNSQERLALGAIRGGYLYNFWQDETNVRGLWRRSPLEAYAAGAPQWDVLLDVDALAAAEGANWVFAGTECLPSDETCCLVSLSDGGKDAHVVREFNAATKRFVENGFSLPEAKTQIVWADADTVIVSSDWGEGSLTESGYPFIAKLWRRGVPIGVAGELIRGEPYDVGFMLGALDDERGKRSAIGVRMETFFVASHFRLDSIEPREMTLPMKATLRGLHRGQLVFTIEEDWEESGQIFKAGALLAMPFEKACDDGPPISVIYQPGAREAIEQVAITSEAVLVAGTRNVAGLVQRFAFANGAWRQGEDPFPLGAGMVSIVSSAETEALAFALTESQLTPQTLIALDTKANTARAVKALPALFDTSGMVTRQYEAISTDGERIPYFVTGRESAMGAGEAPTVLYGYGGFQVSMNPSYMPVAGKLWLESGGLFVIANIRGGGEFGPAWHQAGLKTKRQIVYDDFIAVAEDLIARKITKPRRLGIMGGSNGGLLMGVMLNQRPDLFHAAVVQVPLLDMLRYHLLLAGASWVAEYGSPERPEERAWLETLSPYHNLRAAPAMPVPFFITSSKDDRVHPGHARKFAAKMEKLGLPFWFYENVDGGHAASANQTERAKRQALEYAYLKQRLMD
jgi:prolyl oligopeptidase